MSESHQKHIENIRSGERAQQGESYQALMQASEEPVNWAHEIWDDLIELMEAGDNRARTIAAQVLCNLAKSAPDNRMPETLPRLMEVTRDQKFVTARHSLQALWRVAIVNQELTRMTVDALAERFEECAEEKNCTLIRHDITCVMKTIHDHTADDAIAERSLALIETEPDKKYRNKYLKVWKGYRG